MRPCCRHLLPCLALIALWGPVAMAGMPLMSPVLVVDFEAQTLGEAIGTGGPTQGQPVSSGMQNVVVSGELDGQSLRVTDDLANRAVHMRFEFLDELEQRDGLLWISVQVKPEVADDFFIRLREYGTSAKNFGEVLVNSAGALRVGDAAGDAGLVTAEGAVAVGTVHTIDWIHDLDAGTHSVSLDGVEVLSDRAHGIDTSAATGRGIGALLVGFPTDADTDGVMHLDTIEVSTSLSLEPIVEPIFKNSFEVEPEAAR